MKISSKWHFQFDEITALGVFWLCLLTMAQDWWTTAGCCKDQYLALGYWGSRKKGHPKPGTRHQSLWPFSGKIFFVVFRVFLLLSFIYLLLGSGTRNMMSLWYDVNIQYCGVLIISGLFLGLQPPNERHRYKVTPSLIEWAIIYNQPCCFVWWLWISGQMYFIGWKWHLSSGSCVVVASHLVRIQCPLTHPPLDKMAAILADDNFKCIFLNENDKIPIRISLKFFPRSPVDNKPALVQVMAWRRIGDKPLPEPIDAYMRH